MAFVPVVHDYRVKRAWYFDQGMEGCEWQSIRADVLWDRLFDCCHYSIQYVESVFEIIQTDLL